MLSQQPFNFRHADRGWFTTQREQTCTMYHYKHKKCFQVQIDETPATSKILGRQDVHRQLIWSIRTLHG